MPNSFFTKPILNSPYEAPCRHWELNAEGQPTQRIVDERRLANFVTSAIPTPQKAKGKAKQGGHQLDLGFFQDETARAISSESQKYELARIINDLRSVVTDWREKDYIGAKISPETERLLKHWRHHKFSGIRPFFCQLEAVETAIWLSEVAPKAGKRGQWFDENLSLHNDIHNPGLNRIALKMATGAGKTAVIAMLIAWQTINAVRHPNSKLFTNGFLVVAPGLTIKDRLRVLLPNDPDSYYQERQLVPQDMLQDLQRARIVITNYHAFKQREKIDIARGTRNLLKGRTGEDIETIESEGEMLRRVMGSLMGLKNIMVFNDEGHHCYRVKLESSGELGLQEGEDKGDASREADENNEAARLWISGLDIVQKNKGISRVFDLSATPFFIRGSGQPEGTLFPWTMSDFSLMDAIECGIVKLPRVPVADNMPDASSHMPKFRELWKHIGKHMPKKGRQQHDPRNLNEQQQFMLLVHALDALYGHYEKVFALWGGDEKNAPPCFILVCNNTTTSKLLYDYISGCRLPDGGPFVPGRCRLFSNYDENGNPSQKPRTILIDSRQLESGDKLPDDFRKIYAAEIERFRHEAAERGTAQLIAQEFDDATLLREVMNTVGKPGRLGGGVRCVVSVSMLTEGWDANNVTHILGVRAFGTQLLCEQVIGRALRRRSYELNEEGLFSPEYADVMGVPFDFASEPVVAKPAPPADFVVVQAIRPERDQWEITFPRVVGYRIEQHLGPLRAKFDVDSELYLTTEIVGPTEAKNAAIIGETANMPVQLQTSLRRSSLIMHLAKHLLTSRYSRDGNIPLDLYGQMKAIVAEWLDSYLKCGDGVSEIYLQWTHLADEAAQRIHDAILRARLADNPGQPCIEAVLDPFNPTGSTRHVKFPTSKKARHAAQRRCHLNYCMYDGEWEQQFCLLAEKHPSIIAYVKNYHMGFEVPYSHAGRQRQYVPDFILRVDGGRGENDPLSLIVETKGRRAEEDKDKKAAMDNFWVPGVNRLEEHGRWKFAEMTDVHQMEAELDAIVRAGAIEP